MAKKDDAENLEPSATVLTATGDPEPNPATDGAAVPYDIGGMPPPAPRDRTVLVVETEGEIGVAFDGGPRKAYKVSKRSGGGGGTIKVPAADNPARVAAVIPGARLAEED